MRSTILFLANFFALNLSIASAWTLFTRSGKSIDYTSWFSEEGNGYSARQTAPIAGLVCDGRYCDNLRLITVRDGTTQPVQNSAHWTRWFSDGNPSWADCPIDMIVNEMQCSGRYCDDIRLQCGRLSSDYRVISSDIRNVDWFSEEEGERRCDDGYYFWGMACDGSYCDNLQLNCVRVEYEPPNDPWKSLVRGENTVTKSRWFNDEDGGYSFAMTGPLGGIGCRGNNCDEKRLIGTKRSEWAAFDFSDVSWTGWFSEEGIAEANCAADRLVIEVQCRESYCDEMRLGCARLVQGYRINGGVVLQSPWFSEEDDEGYCPDGTYVQGIMCDGDYCDNIRLKCRRVQYNDEYQQVPSPPRPVYIINHRTNSEGDIEDALKEGANALEIDVQYGNGQWVVDHDGVFLWSTELDDWLDTAAEMAEEFGEAFALIIFDIKTPVQLMDLRNKARNKLPAGLNRIFSVAEYSSRTALQAIDQGLRSYEGVAIDFDNDPVRVQSHFTGRGVTNFWYGNGICVPCLALNVRSSLVQATGLRDGGAGIKKTYVWTLGQKSSIADYFKNVKVDGVMVNTGEVTMARNTAVQEGKRISVRSESAFRRF